MLRVLWLFDSAALPVIWVPLHHAGLWIPRLSPPPSKLGRVFVSNSGAPLPALLPSYPHPLLSQVEWPSL